jgi:hypothetical protein
MIERRSRFARCICGGWLAVLVLSMLATTAALAQVPGRVSFQGLLLDAAGNPVNGSANLAFGIFAAATGGAALWTESHPGVAAVDGIYDVELGSTTPLTPALLTGGARYLEVSVSGATLAP